MFEEINGTLYNLVNVDKIEKDKEVDGDKETFLLIYYNSKSQGLIKERFDSEKERDEKYDKLRGVVKKRGLLG